MLAILTNDELEELTGYKRSVDVAKCLLKHKIYYVEGKDGQIKTTDKWVEQAGQSRAAKNDGFNEDF